MLAPANVEHAERVLAMCEYVDALKKHDWAFEFSDDRRAYRKGYESRAQLRILQQRIDPDFRIWNQHAPERDRV
jgi:hypothetical protein